MPSRRVLGALRARPRFLFVIIAVGLVVNVGAALALERWSHLGASGAVRGAIAATQDPARTLAVRPAEAEEESGNVQEETAEGAAKQLTVTAERIRSASVQLAAGSAPRAVYNVVVTAYSSSVDETDGNPYVTASGSYVRDGVVAANFLPIGAQVRIPELYGDKVFVVEDRMHRRYSYRVDVWMPTKWEAKHFGKQYVRIEVL